MSTLDEIAGRTRHSRSLLADVLAEELAAGRVVLEGDDYRLVRERFEPEVLAGFARLSSVAQHLLLAVDQGWPQPTEDVVEHDHGSPGELARSFA